MSYKWARLNWLSPDWTFVQDTSSLSNLSPYGEIKGPDNGAVSSFLTSTPASGIVSLFPEGERVSSSARRTTKTN